MNLTSKLIAIFSCGVLFTSSADSKFRFGPAIGLGIGKITGLKEIGKDSSAVVSIPFGGTVQMDMGNFGLESGLYYVPKAAVFTSSFDTDSDGIDDDQKLTISTSSIEIPVLAYYQLRGEKGFWKFGGGLSYEQGIGKVNYKDEETNTTALDVDIDDKRSYSAAGIKSYDFLLMGRVGYQFNFESWSLSLDLKSKYGLVDRLASNSIDSGSAHTFLNEFLVSFLF